MKSRAAVAFVPGQQLKIVEIDVAPPKKGEVLIQFDARLVQTSERRVIASRRFVIHQPISGSSMNEVVEAFGQASDRLAADILRWLENTSAMR